MIELNTVCDAHCHGDGLPERELRQHVLATAIRAADACLKERGYAEPDRSAEVLHVALEDALDLVDIELAESN